MPGREMGANADNGGVESGVVEAAAAMLPECDIFILD